MQKIYFECIISKLFSFFIYQSKNLLDTNFWRFLINMPHTIDELNQNNKKVLLNSEN